MHTKSICGYFGKYSLLSMRIGMSAIILSCCPFYIIAQLRDSVAVLKTIRVKAVKKKSGYASPTPVQLLEGEALQQLNAVSAGDAARYFSGALVKDYGGIGGLKTISVRSLGASSTGIIYDGIPVADQQTGQVDLSRFSTTFIQSVALQQGGIQHELSPARSSASAATLSIESNTFRSPDLSHASWQAGIRAGSFQSWQPFAAWYHPLKKNAAISIQAEVTHADGNYPVQIRNGAYSTVSGRNNADIRSLQSAINLFKQFTDSATLQVKAGGYTSERGLPGAIVFFNDRSVQRLYDNVLFAQAMFRKKIGSASSVLAAAKYNHSYTRYTDPDYLNNQGGLNNRYTQQEAYTSLAANHYFSSHVTLAAASDIAFTTLKASQAGSVFPRRISLWENLSLQITQSRWQLYGNILYNGIADRTDSIAGHVNKQKFTPALAFNFTPSGGSPFLLRFFYKAIFRMPSFNDLYYRFVGNIALRPEYAKQYNAGLTWTGQWLPVIRKISFSADLYYNLVKDKIVAVPNKNLFVWTMLNLGKVGIRGIDINSDARGRFSTTVGWTVRMAYTWQQALDISNAAAATYKNRIPYTPDHSGSGLFSADWRNWEMGYGLLFSGRRYTLGENSAFNRLPGWFTQDVFIAKRLVFKWVNLRIRGSVNNIADQRYDIIRYYPMPGRSFTINLLFNHL